MRTPAPPLPAAPDILSWCEGETCCSPEWEEAYQRFETPAEEVLKFTRRFRRLGLDALPAGSRVVDLFSGRGNALVALERMGFSRLEGVDISPRLLSRYRGPARLYVGDCRDLRFESASRDAVTVNGGLHHLPVIPGDLDLVLGGIRRVLAPGGRLFLTEPWRTPFLSLVEWCGRSRALRRLWPRFDALTCMNEIEGPTYRRWLASGGEIEALLLRHFVPEKMEKRWGKLYFRGRRRSP